MRNINSLITVLALSFATLSVTACATSGDEQSSDEYSDAQSDASAPGKVDLWQASDAQWHFHVVSGNGRTLLTSEAYTSRTGAINGLLSVVANGVDPAQYSLNQAANGGYNLRLKALNNEIIAFTQVYSTKSSATRAITSCVRAITSHLDVIEANTSGARVEVAAGATDGFHFNMVAQNGETVLSSQHYASEAAAWNGAYAVQVASTDATAFAVKTSTDGRFYFTLSADNGQIIGVSQMYTTKASAQAGISSVQGLMRGMQLL